MDSARFFFGRPYPPFYPFSTHVLPSFYPLHWHLSTGNFWLSSHCQEAQESRWPQWMILGPRVMSYCIYKLEIGKDNYIKLYTHLFQDYLSIYIYIYHV